MDSNLKNKITIVIIFACLVFIGIIIFLIIHMNRIEERYIQLLEQQHTAGDRGGRGDLYISGPVKNTVLKHTSEILGCYKEFLGKTNNSGNRDISKEGTVTLDWQVDSDGTAISPAVVKSDISDQTFLNCIIDNIKTWHFPEPPFGVKKYVEHTFKFKDEKK